MFKIQDNKLNIYYDESFTLESETNENESINDDNSILSEEIIIKKSNQVIQKITLKVDLSEIKYEPFISIDNSSINKINNEIEYNYDDFNWENYRNFYDDLKHIDNKFQAWTHWLQNGINENRIFFKNNSDYDKNFDWQSYIEYNDDLKKCGLNKKEDAWFHWINYGKSEGRLYYTYTDSNYNNSEEYKNFDWEIYINNYSDLKNINNKLDAYNHWIKYGKAEKRVYYNIYDEEIKKYKLIKDKENKLFLFKNNSNLILKSNYDNHGTHYFGWKGAINYLLNELIEKHNNNTFELYFNYNIFFDEWIEKLLLWGNKVEKEKYLNDININNYKILSFIHNPPFTKFNDCKKNNKETIDSVLIYDDYQLNENLINILRNENLIDKIVYLYTLSNSHKEYLYDTYPFLRDKLLSIYHPIEINEKDDYFNYNKFLMNRKIIHIGWWLRNFKIFINFNTHNKFKKILLVKEDFEEGWKTISNNYNVSGLEIKQDLSNEDYEKIFIDHIIFIDLLDCVANNTILECLKFNTPIITRRIPSAEEYLGTDYPLFFENENDLINLENESYLLEKIYKAYIYLKTKDKKHISLENFKKKILYDLNKLKIYNEDKKLTWFCFILDDNYLSLLDNFILMFLQQGNNELILLKFIILEDCFLKNSIFFENIINEQKNISFIVIKNENYKYTSDILNYCILNTTTEYLTIFDINDKIDNTFSKLNIEYLCHKNIDVSFKQYSGFQKDINCQFKKEMIVNKYSLNSLNLPNTGIVWRKKIHDYIGNFNYFENDDIIFYDFWERCIQYNLNIVFISLNDKYI